MNYYPGVYVLLWRPGVYVCPRQAARRSEESEPHVAGGRTPMYIIVIMIIVIMIIIMILLLCIYIYIHTHIHTCICIYIYIYIVSVRMKLPHVAGGRYTLGLKNEEPPFFLFRPPPHHHQAWPGSLGSRSSAPIFTPEDRSEDRDGPSTRGLSPVCHVAFV